MCFVTIKGQPVFARPVRRYTSLRYDPYVADFLNEEYNHIIASTRWRFLHFKTIGAVEFQTVHQNQSPPFLCMLRVKDVVDAAYELKLDAL
jgi:hypothetical protein